MFFPQIFSSLVTTKLELDCRQGLGVDSWTINWLDLLWAELDNTMLETYAGSLTDKAELQKQPPLVSLNSECQKWETFDVSYSYLGSLIVNKNKSAYNHTYTAFHTFFL